VEEDLRKNGGQPPPKNRGQTQKKMENDLKKKRKTTFKKRKWKMTSKKKKIPLKCWAKPFLGLAELSEILSSFFCIKKFCFSFFLLDTKPHHSDSFL
jgi:hypothetical protein